MFYSYAITIPANTTATAPIIQNLKLCVGRILQFRVFFPAGCSYLVKARALHNGAYLYPYVGSDYLFGDNEADVIRDSHELPGGNTNLQFIAWNEDAYNDHTLKVTIDVASVDEANTLRQTQATLYGIQNLFTRVNHSLARLEARM